MKRVFILGAGAPIAHSLRFPSGKNFLWNIAVQEIKQANEIVIWGYSLPPTDFHSQWLLRKADSKNLQRVWVINPAAWKRKSLEADNKFRDRFVNLFKTGDFKEENICFVQSLPQYLEEQKK